MNRLFLILVLLFTSNAPGFAQPGQLARHDFSKGLGEWIANPMVAVVGATADGLRLRLKSPDPYLVGPPSQYPSGKPVTVTVRMRSNGESVAQIYHGLVFSEKDSRVFEVIPDGQWHEYVISLPPLASGARLRLDPPSGGDPIELAWILVEVGAERLAEAWAKPSELRGKKMIAGGQFTTTGGDRAVTSRYLARHPEITSTLPFDGLVIPALIDAKWSDEMKLPREDRFLHGVVWNATRIPPAAIDAIAGELNSIRWRGITDNFLNYSMIDGTRGRHMPDFTDDRDWAALEHNARQAARLCRISGMKGFWLDTEQYGNYRWRTESGVPEFESGKPKDLKFPLGKDSPEVLRKRGGQWIRAVQQELPGIKIMITFAWSPDANEYGPIRGANAFLDGVLEGIRAPGQLIHGYENTFYFGQGPGTKHTRDGFPGGRERFEAARANMRKWRSFSIDPTRYDIFLRPGMAAWVEDDPWALWDGWPSGGPESFWSNLPLALAYSEEYVWVWSEHTRYHHPHPGRVNPFLSSLRNRTFNTGEEKVSLLEERFLSDPLQNGWYFDFDMMAVSGARKPGHQVSLMSLENIPYQWQAESRGLKVRSMRAVPQRRRFAHPVHVRAGNSGFMASFDFQFVPAVGESGQSLQLGLFTADFPSHRDSLSLRISGGGGSAVVLDINGASREIPIPASENLVEGKSYRLIFDKQESGSVIHVSLSEVSGERVLKSLFQADMPHEGSKSLPEWDEIGVALAEAVIPGRAKYGEFREAPLECLVGRVSFRSPDIKGK